MMTSIARRCPLSLRLWRSAAPRQQQQRRHASGRDDFDRGSLEAPPTPGVRYDPMLNQQSTTKEYNHVAHARYVKQLKQMGRRNAHGVADKPDVEPFLKEEEMELRLRDDLSAELGDGTRLTDVEVMSWSQVFASMYAKYWVLICCVLIGLCHLVNALVHKYCELQATIKAEIDVMALSDDEAALVEEFTKLDYLQRSLNNLHTPK
eukprot:Rhum_TRINITY_DN201_c0_g1::Rhum_TRINITY_DN201_c0_g1_i1::g.721::m.721